MGVFGDRMGIRPVKNVLWLSKVFSFRRSSSNCRHEGQIYNTNYVLLRMHLSVSAFMTTATVLCIHRIRHVLLAAASKERSPWIVKPAASSRGRGIFLIMSVCDSGFAFSPSRALVLIIL